MEINVILFCNHQAGYITSFRASRVSLFPTQTHAHANSLLLQRRLCHSVALRRSLLTGERSMRQTTRRAFTHDRHARKCCLELLFSPLWHSLKSAESHRTVSSRSHTVSDTNWTMWGTREAALAHLPSKQMQQWCNGLWGSDLPKSAPHSCFSTFPRQWCLADDVVSENKTGWCGAVWRQHDIHAQTCNMAGAGKKDWLVKWNVIDTK